MVLSTAYFPPIQYLSKFLLKNTKIQIERYENFQKQSYRNRCIILSPNGIQPLSVPIKKGISPNLPIFETEIDYKIPWQSTHLKSLETAYRSSPFFEFYIDAFLQFFSQKEPSLLVFNSAILKILLQEFGIDQNFSFSTTYTQQILDFRKGIHPKKKEQVTDKQFVAKEYTQVFNSKFPFQANLSALDLLFNEGPNAVNILCKSVMQPKSE